MAVSSPPLWLVEISRGASSSSHILVRDVTSNSLRKSCRGSALQLGHITHAAKASLPVPPGLVQVESSPPSLAEAIPRWCVPPAAYPDLFPFFYFYCSALKLSSRKATTSMATHTGNSATSEAPKAAGAALSNTRAGRITGT